jgi:hypothetical protein
MPSVTFTKCTHNFTGLRDDAGAHTITFQPTGNEFNTKNPTGQETISFDGLDLQGGQYNGHYTPAGTLNVSNSTINWGGECSQIRYPLQHAANGKLFGRSPRCW